MDEARWQSCDDPRKLVEWLRGRAGDRKLRLFACASWRHWWETTADGQEGGEPGQDITPLLDYAEQWAESGRRPDMTFPSGFGWHPLVAQHAFDAANWTVRQTAGFKSRLDCRRDDAKDRERAAEHQARLLKDLFGNPFHSAVLDRCWLTPAVVGLAQVIYDERRWEDLPVLADALEEAGCSDAELLGHLQGPGPHARGCFVLDRLLGRG
jgi:hypothetical protein